MSMNLEIQQQSCIGPTIVPPTPLYPPSSGIRIVLFDIKSDIRNVSQFQVYRTVYSRFAAVQIAQSRIEHICWFNRACCRLPQFLQRRHVVIYTRATRYMARPCVRPSVCLSLSQVGVLSKRLNGSSWFCHKVSLDLIFTVLSEYSCISTNKGTSLWNSVPNLDLEKFDTARRPSTTQTMYWRHLRLASGEIS